MKLIEMNIQQDALFFDDFEDRATVRAEEVKNVALLLTPPVKPELVVAATTLSSTSTRVITAADYSPTETGSSISIGSLCLIALSVLVVTFGVGMGAGIGIGVVI